MTVNIAKWSLEDYHRMLDVGLLTERHVELLNGEIIDMAPEGAEHAQLTTDTADYLRDLLGKEVLIRDAKPITLLENNSEPEPDLAIVEPKRSLYRQRHPYPENVFWLIEYADTSLSKDSENKRITYATVGIPEYWLVDLKNRQVKVWRQPIDRDYQVEITFTNGEVSPLAFPQISVSIPRLLEGSN